MRYVAGTVGHEPSLAISFLETAFILSCNPETMMVYVFSSNAEVAELVDAQDSGSCEEIPRAGSIPVFGTTY
jgi:hypothetical protein